MEQCEYVLKDGHRCHHDCNGEKLCFWHDPNQAKKSADTALKLEAIAESGKSLEGFALKRANLEGVNLVNRNHQQGYDLRNIDFYRANMRSAHLFRADLRGASLMKSNLTDANLHQANLEGANLLGTKFKGARIENVNWGKFLLQEQQGYEAITAKKTDLSVDYFEQAEEICRAIRNTASHQGLVDMAGRFFHKEMTMKRKQLPIWSGQRVLSKFIDLSCGYGERPTNVVLFSIAVILISAICFFIFGVDQANQFHSLSEPSEAGRLVDFFNAMYFSVVTFTTLGYGDIVPVGLSRVVVSLEAFSGSFILALFVVVFVKKMTR